MNLGTGTAVGVVALGALAVSTSAIFIDLSGASAVTSSTWRCALAVPLVALAARWERPPTTPPRDEGPSRRSRALLLALCGSLFAGDMVWWARAIDSLGAGLSTVLVNAQVVVVPLLAWAVDREQPSRRYPVALPVVLVGVVLAGGVLEEGGEGSRSVTGVVDGLLAALSYSGFLFLLRRLGGTGAVRGYRDTLVVATMVCAGVGVATADLQIAVGWSTLGWFALVVVVGQVPGWLLVALASPALRPELAASVLLLTPVGALVLSVLVLGQVPTVPQAAGCALILSGVLIQSVGLRGRGRD